MMSVKVPVALFAGALAIALLIFIGVEFKSLSVQAPSLVATEPIPAHFVGSAACTQCHQAQHDAWQGSHHDLAMQAASVQSVLAPFKGERFIEDGVTSVFTQQDGHFYVSTEGPDGKPQQFEITYTFGISPLQQYIIPMAGGAMQALTIAWDSRPAGRGGQRWFHLQAGQHIHAGNALHWTGRQNNWNFMCAECHMTQFKKNYNADTRTYNSSWSAINVGCEACHGPGERHVTWAGLPDTLRSNDVSKGLTLTLDERKAVRWIIDPATGNARADRADRADEAVRPFGVSHKEVEMCARCHSHRSQISDDYHPEHSLLDSHIPSLLEHDLFWDDGQMHQEVYNYASFEQSKMASKGVKCSVCLDPLSQKLRFPGNQTCFQCHMAAKYEAVSHTFHPIGSTGASCAACHMPTTTYMSIDPRHDHSIRVPRPDLSLSNGAPNACTQCHADKTVQWAADAARRWYPHFQERQAPLAATLMANEKLDGHALAMLLDVMADRDQTSVVRATAVSRVPVGANAERIRALLQDGDALVRLAAVEALSVLPAELRSTWLRPLLGDPVRAIRIAAARWLVNVPMADWSASDRAALNAAKREYVAVQTFNADRPEAYNNLGTFYADQGDWSKAESALKTAIGMDPDSDFSSLNLADIYGAEGQEEKAQQVLRQVIHQHPANALAQLALGLSLIRDRQTENALAYLKEASRLEPTNAHFSTIYILALDRNNDHARATGVWNQAMTLHPDDQELLSICSLKGWENVQRCAIHAQRAVN